MTREKNRQKKRWKGIGLFARINLVISVVVLGTLILLCVLLTHNMIVPSVQKDAVLSEEASSQLADLFSGKYSTVFNQSKLLHTQDHVAQRLSNFRMLDDDFFSITDIRYINNYLTAVRYADKDILDVVLIPLDSSNVFYASYNTARWAKSSYDYESVDVVHKLLSSDERIVVAYSREQPYMSSNLELITFAVKVFDPMGASFQTPIGIMLIHYPLSVFQDAYQKLGNLAGGSVFLIDQEGQVIFSNEQSCLGQTYDERVQDNAQWQTYKISTYGMRLVSIIPLDAISDATTAMLVRLFTLFFPAMLFMVGVIFLCNRQYRQRIEHLSAAMKNYVSGEERSTIEVQHEDELGMLAMQFNEMCDRLNRQIELHYQAEISRRTAELNALQAQINPHFLFNTIESIRMRAVEDGNMDVSEMLTQLGQMFHWMISMDQQIVYLEDEIDYNEAYLELQKLRYDDSFDYTFEIPGTVLYYGLPKFTLQPVIENALLHGLQENRLSGAIRVSAHVAEQTLVFQVCDNGSGMNEAQLKRLQCHITGEQSDPKFGIGIRNVHARIRLLFGADYGVSVNSQLHTGTTVTITLPAMGKKEMEQMLSADRQEINAKEH